MKKDYGKIAVTNGGIWNEQTPYEKLTTVSRGGQGYLSFEDNQGVDPEQDCDPTTGIGTKWFRIATKGDPGTTDYNELINKPFIPTALSELIADALHRTVSDQEKSTWNDKTDKVSNATNGNFAGLDSNGNLTDSGKKASDFATAAQGALADTAYQKPQGGIPESDMETAVQQAIDNVPSILQYIEAIAQLVPEQASSENQLADKAFVNSSIQTNTADFKGTRNLVSDLSLTTSATQQQIATALASAISSADNNDYCFVQIPTDDATPTQIARVDRYKYNGSAWLFEWSLNNSSFTAEQWAAINSTVTSGDVDKLRLLPTKAQLDTLFAAKQNTLVSGTNIKTINSNSILGSGNLDVHDVFFGTYPTTSIDDIDRAYYSNQIVILKDSVMRGTGSFVLSYVDYELSPMGAFVFVSLIQNQIYWFTLDSINGYSDVSVIPVGTYTKPQSGIPASDIANGVIPDVSQFITKSVNDLVNYYTKSETYTQSEVNTLIGSIQHFHYEIYASLQDITTPATNVLYLIGPTGSGSDKYEEYVYANNAFVKIGDTSIDLSNYVTTQVLNTALAAKQDTLVSGTNIKSINNESILGAGNVNFAKYKDTLISSDAITCETTETVEGVSVYCSNADYYLQPNQKIVFADTVGDNTLYIINYDDISNPFIISSGKGSISWNNFTNNDVRIQLASSNNTGQTLSASRYWRGTDNVFIAEYGVTTAQEIGDAVNAGKEVVLFHTYAPNNQHLYILSQYSTSAEAIKFTCIEDTAVYMCLLRRNTGAWSANKIFVENSSSKVTDFTNINNYMYPTTKAVADYVSGIVGDINSILETI